MNKIIWSCTVRFTYENKLFFLADHFQWFIYTKNTMLSVGTLPTQLAMWYRKVVFILPTCTYRARWLPWTPSARSWCRSGTCRLTGASAPPAWTPCATWARRRSSAQRTSSKWRWGQKSRTQIRGENIFVENCQILLSIFGNGKNVVAEMFTFSKLYKTL